MRLRVATLNAWALPPPFAPEVRKRMTEIGNRLAQLDIDVMAFQEVWTPDARDLLLRGARAAGLLHAWHANAAFGGGGLLVASRLPILEARFERFALRGHPEEISQGDYYGGKGFARIQLETALGPLTCINTHLHARHTSEVSHEYRGVRTGQVVQLAMAIREVGDPIVAAGDFNFEEGQAEYQILTGLTGFRDLAAEVDRRQPTSFRGNVYRARKRKRDRRIDFLFTRDGHQLSLEPRTVTRIFDEVLDFGDHPGGYSNHAGVMAEFAVVPRAGTSVPSPDRRVVELAAQLISEGRRRARRRQQEGRLLAGAGISCALVSAAGIRAKPMTRRKLLRNTLQCAGLVTLAPGIGFSILSEYFVPEELAAFDAAAKRLSGLAFDPADVAHRRTAPPAETFETPIQEATSSLRDGFGVKDLG